MVLELTDTTSCINSVYNSSPVGPYGIDEVDAWNIPEHNTFNHHAIFDLNCFLTSRMNNRMNNTEVELVSYEARYTIAVLNIPDKPCTSWTEMKP